MEEIAKENNIPSNYLVQILIELKTAKIVKSVRGKSGGYLLASSPSQITFADVLTCIYGSLLESPAMADEACPTALRETWQRLRLAMEQEAGKVNFQQLAEAVQDPARMFYI